MVLKIIFVKKMSNTNSKYKVEDIEYQTLFDDKKDKKNLSINVLQDNYISPKSIVVSPKSIVVSSKGIYVSPKSTYASPPNSFLSIENLDLSPEDHQLINFVTTRLNCTEQRLEDTINAIKNKDNPNFLYKRLTRIVLMGDIALDTIPAGVQTWDMFCDKIPV
jgi:hypothetical protein